MQTQQRQWCLLMRLSKDNLTFITAELNCRYFICFHSPLIPICYETTHLFGVCIHVFHHLVFYPRPQRICGFWNGFFIFHGVLVGLSMFRPRRQTRKILSYDSNYPCSRRCLSCVLHNDERIEAQNCVTLRPRLTQTYFSSRRNTFFCFVVAV